MKKIITTISALAIVFSLASIPVLAVYAEGNEEYQQSETKKKKSYSETVKTQEQIDAAKRKTQEIKQEVQQKRLELKKDVCEARQDKIQAKIPRLSNGASSVKEAFDKVYERVQGFYDSGQLAVDNYEELKAAVDAAKANAEAAVQAAKDYKLEVDCENPSTGEQLGQFREAVKEAKEALKDYRKALVDLISAMRSASAQANEDGESNE